MRIYFLLLQGNEERLLHWKRRGGGWRAFDKSWSCPSGFSIFKCHVFILNWILQFAQIIVCPNTCFHEKVMRRRKNLNKSIWDLRSNPFEIWELIHLRFEIKSIWDQIHLRSNPFGIWDQIHLRFEIKSIWDLRSNPFEIWEQIHLRFEIVVDCFRWRAHWWAKCKSPLALLP